MNVEGSSPLTQGKRCMILPTGRPVRLIPTHAGKPDFARRARRLGGLIPAHAGKTMTVPPVAIHRRAHPRSREENWSITAMTAFAPGSSPLTRGKLGYQPTHTLGAGLIPAHAGKTHKHGAKTAVSWAHPRSHGENILTTGDYDGNLGSSPLTRGKRLSMACGGSHGGLIPTHTGKTAASTSRCWRPTAHPHSHGENAPGIASASWFQGSSPLTRGKHHGTDRRRARRGLIPTHAGKTAGHRARFRQQWAHPHSRRENPATARRIVCQVGSSPLTQGKHHRRHGRYLRRGLIPTHAGKNSTGGTWETKIVGSSPLTRGKRS